jgi:hypothetical protein
METASVCIEPPAPTGLPHVDGPLGGAILMPRPLAEVDYFSMALSGFVFYGPGRDFMRVSRNTG